MDDGDRPLLEDTEDSTSELGSSSISELAFDNFSTSLVGETHVGGNDYSEAQYVAVDALPASGARYFSDDAHMPTASGKWRGKSAAQAFTFLLILSIVQLVLALFWMLVLGLRGVDIVPVITGSVGLALGLGYKFECIPGAHLEIQVRLVYYCTLACVILGILSQTFFTIVLGLVFVLDPHFHIHIFYPTVYVVYWAHTFVFAWVGAHARSVLRRLHPERWGPPHGP